jgi:uncharacterized protein (DUF2252 family)
MIGEVMNASRRTRPDPGWSLQVRRASAAERAEVGRERRDRVPLEAHAELVVPADRASALSILHAQDADRIQDLVPIRYGRMLSTPFTFLRGSAAVMAADLGAGARTDMHVQLCGDAHLSNFGLFASPERRLVFDINDFDETLPGPFEWDVKRLIASVVVAGRNNGLDTKSNRRIARASTAAYRRALAAASAMNPLEVFYYKLDFDQLTEKLAVSKKDRKRVDRTRRKAAGKSSLGALDKLTDVVDGRRVIASNPPLIVTMTDAELHDEITLVQAFFDDYRATLYGDRRQLLDQYSLSDLARKVVGVGSVGTRCLIALFESGDGQPLFLQIKEATSSVLEAHLETSRFDQAGRRIVDGQRIIQATPDSLLGSAQYARKNQTPIDFYIRQLWDGKASAEVETMTPDLLERYAVTCGAALARAHARSGDAAMISGYLGDDDTFDRAIAAFAQTYADRTDQDYAEMKAAADAGQIDVVYDL